MNGLEQKLAQWDGKDTQAAREIYRQYSSSTDFCPFLLQSLAVPRYQIAASWLLKHHLEQQRVSLQSAQLDTLCQYLTHLTHWQSQLHLLQLLPGHCFSQAQRRQLEPFIRGAITSDNKFVRAWAYNALHQLALRFTDLQRDAWDIIACAERDEASSVKARLRHLKSDGAQL